MIHLAYHYDHDPVPDLIIRGSLRLMHFEYHPSDHHRSLFLRPSSAMYPVSSFKTQIRSDLKIINLPSTLKVGSPNLSAMYSTVLS